MPLLFILDFYVVLASLGRRPIPGMRAKNKTDMIDDTYASHHATACGSRLRQR